MKIAGLVVCRQRPGTAKGHMLISLEDETDIANAFVPCATFEANHLVITQETFLLIKGTLGIVEGVVSVYTWHLEGLSFGGLGMASYDFK